MTPSKLYCVSSFAGSFVAAGGEASDITVTEPGSSRPALHLSGHCEHVNAIAVAKEPDAENAWTLLSASADSTICQWHVSISPTTATLVRGHTFTGHEGPVRNVCWVHSARVLASAGGHDDMSVRVWDARKVVAQPTSRLASFMGRKVGTPCVAVMRGHTAPVECIERVSDTLLASASLDETVRLWDIGRGGCVSTLRGHRREVLCVRTIDENLLVSSSDDRTVKCWDIRTQQSTHSWSGAHAGSIYCVLPRAFGREELIISGGAGHS